FDTPWYAWPTTAALIASVVALGVAWWTFVFQRHMKLLEAIWKIGHDLLKFQNGVSLASIPSPNFGVRLERIGGWDGFAEVLNELGASTDLLVIYGDPKVAQAGKELFEEAKKLYIKVHKSVVDSHYPKALDESNEAHKFLVSVIDGDAQAIYQAKWVRLQELTKTNLQRSFIRPGKD